MVKRIDKMIKSFSESWKDSTGETLSNKKAREIIGDVGLSEWQDEIDNTPKIRGRKIVW